MIYNLSDPDLKVKVEVRFSESYNTINWEQFHLDFQNDTLGESAMRLRDSTGGHQYFSTSWFL